MHYVNSQAIRIYHNIGAYSLKRLSEEGSNSLEEKNIHISSKIKSSMQRIMLTA